MSYQREYSRRLKVALVGVGSHAYRNILPVLHHLPVRLSALCDVNIALAENTAPEFGVSRTYQNMDSMLAQEQLDAVLLCAGPQHHPVLALQALKAGLHVWMEKPPGFRAAEVEALLPYRKNCAVVVGFKKAHMPAAQKARELFVDGTLGPVRTILGVYPMSIPYDGASVLAKLEWQNWLANGCHPLSFLLAVGGPVAAVTTHRCARGGGVVVIEFTNGAMGNLHLAEGGNSSQPLEHYSVFGQSCYLSIDNVTRVTLHRAIPFEYGRTTSFVPPGVDSGAVTWEPQQMLGTLENQSLFTQGTFQELQAFCRQALGEVPVSTSISDPASLEFAVHLMQVYESILISSADRVPVPHGRNI